MRGIRRIFRLERQAAPFDVGHAGVRKIVDTAHEGIWLFDAAGRTTFVNRRMAEMLGAAPEDLIGTRLAEFVDQEEREHAERDLPGWMRGNADTRLRHLTRRDGADLWTQVSASPIENEYHAIVGMLGMFTDITERMQMEHALRRAETEFRIVFDSSAVGIVVVNAQGFAVMANTALLNMLGYRREEIAEISFAKVTHPDDVDEDRRLYQALMRGEFDCYRREKRYVHRNGNVVWVHVNVSLVRSPDGEPQYAINMVEDVTDKYKAERALRSSENQLRHALDAARMGIWDWDIERDHVQWSANVHKIFNLPPERTPSTLEAIIAMIVPAERERVSREIGEALKSTGNKYVSEYQVAMESGELRCFEARGEVERNPAGRPVRMIGTVVDVTARKAAELALRESEGRFRTLADAAFEGIAISEQGRLIDVNDRLLAIFKMPREAVIGRDAASLFAPESADVVDQKLQDGDPRPYEAVVMRPDGSRAHVEIQARYFKADGDRTLRVAAVRDMAARRKAAELLRQSQERELRAQEEFSRHLLTAQEQERKRLAGELHDGLGQSLSLIRNRMHLALEIPGIAPEVVEHVRAVAKIASEAVAEVRSLAQNLRPIQIEQLGLTESLRSLIDQVADSTATQIDSRLEDVDDVFQGDAATHLYRIVQEALNNVLKHARAHRVTVKLERDVGMLHLDVRDDGTGFTVSGNGAGGLGLTSIRERAQMLGGTLDVRSVPGKGTHVQVDLPFTEPSERP